MSGNNADVGKSKKILIIAGPNGAGKTTFARSFLPAEAEVLRFIIRRRFAAGMKNFLHHYRDRVDDWVLYDNSGSVPVLLEWGEKDE